MQGFSKMRLLIAKHTRNISSLLRNPRSDTGKINLHHEFTRMKHSTGMIGHFRLRVISQKSLLQDENTGFTTALIKPKRGFATLNIDSVTSVKIASTYYSPRDASKSSKLAPILIMHGLFGSKQNWKSLAKSMVLKTGRNIYTLDARNHGESPHTSEMSYFHVAADIVQFMEDTGIEKTILLGHSMGGRAAMTLALSKPHLIEKLIIVDISPINMPDSAMSEMKTFIRGMKEATKSLPAGISISQGRALADQIMLTFCKDIGVRQFLLTNLIESSGHVTWRVNLDVLEKALYEGLLKFPSLPGTCDKETIFICGANSNYVKKSDLGSITRIFPKAQFFFIPGTGHWVHAEKPEEFVRLVVEFVNDDG